LFSLEPHEWKWRDHLHDFIAIVATSGQADSDER
jgi:hypothetical protein